MPSRSCGSGSPRRRRKLFEVRSQRVWPGRDEKVLTSWNGLMIAAFAQAAQVLDEPSYAEAAARAADFILTTMRAPDGRLLRTYSRGSQPKLNGYLEDYAYLHRRPGVALRGDLRAALDRGGAGTGRRHDRAVLGRARTAASSTPASDHEALIARTKDPHDNATPSGNAMAVTALLRLAKLTGRSDLQDKAERDAAAVPRPDGVVADGGGADADRARFPPRAGAGVRGRRRPARR